MKIKKRVLFRGPVLTASGYGVHARMLLESIIDNDEYDITLMNTSWGATPVLRDDHPFINRMRKLSMAQPSGDYDISIQVTIPNEFQKIAKYNIGVTAGIETNIVAPEWIVKCNENVDLVIVPSSHSAKAFNNTVVRDNNGNEHRIKVPVVVLFEGIDTNIFNTDQVKQRDWMNFPSEFNFISVGLGFDKGMGEDRKNLTTLVKWFCEQFRDDKNVGLILKSSIVTHSSVDFKHIKLRIDSIKKELGCGEYPRIHLIHGYLSPEDMAALYKAKNVKAYITLTHGEGYGLPIIEAAACGLPIIATDWSGHLDFLSINQIKKFIPVPYELKPIPDACVWNGVLHKGSQWANPIEQQAKMLMTKVVVNYSKPKQWADELAAHIADNFSLEKMKAGFSNLVEKSGQTSKRRSLTKKLSGYTTVFNGESMGYPYIQSIKSMLGFCDEVVVVDGGSKDGTLEKLRELATQDAKLKVHVKDWDTSIPGIDGQQKQFARSLCRGDFLWQQDADEVVHQDDYPKIKALVEDFPDNTDIVHLPVIEMWAGVENVRCDRHTWKWRLSRNSPFIGHGINRHAAQIKDNKVYAKKGSSDGCEYINPKTGDFAPHRGHYCVETEVLRRTDPEKYAERCNDDFEKYPSIFHYSLVNIPRKIRNYRDFWGKQWDNLYGEDKMEHPFFGIKDPKTLSDDAVYEEAKKVIQQGNPELSFYKHSTDVHGVQFGDRVPLFRLRRTQPDIMKEWIELANKELERCK